MHLAKIQPLRILLLGLLSVTVVASCDDPDSLGLDFQPTDLLIDNQYEDVDLETFTIQLDTINTRNTGRFLLGSYRSKDLGLVTAKSYSQLLPNITIDDNGDTTLLEFAGDNPIYDSMTLSFQIDYLYGDTNATNTITIRRLAESLDENTNYYHNAPEPLLGDEIGVLTDYIPLTDEDNNIVGTVKLNDDYGREIFESILNGVTVDLEDFKNTFYGISMEADNPHDSLMMGFSTFSFNTLVTLYYREDTQDTLSNQYALGFSSRFHKVSADRSGTALQGLSLDNPIPSTDANDQLMIQAGTGTAILVRFPDLENFAEGRRIAVNKADFWIDPIILTPYAATSPVPSTLFYFYANEDGQPELNEDGSRRLLSFETSNEALASDFNQTGLSYTNPTLSLYIQSIIRGDSENNGIIIVPSSEAISTNLAIIGGPNHPEKPMKLRLFYSEVNQ